MIKLAVLNGPNLNLLGKREPSVYGKNSYDDLVNILQSFAKNKNVELHVFQSNHEGELIDKIHELANIVDGFIINAGAYTHTSIALRDALLGVDKPFIEVHISNIFAREEFRHHSFLSDIAIGVISGFGVNSYIYAIDYLIFYLKDKR
ncbi:3-dehydroquinate dehydratase II [Deferribacter desulfuricans SSM1]|uniref:3-dehydroquinate dehydratase n=1 Tax=Deferribacter desulfuricans (strain DSM 14783 / JCM 11476 / NBRC 101012 / SSM1) TaxID=639282 RepID=D3PBH4_DEFDS|nr:type II 3-dehydroquinate dehydratase [Deferribacter desulfuricans]BAI79947.1 3-dehydroquinate dehydratase II [Deferribacter desulfuricans SSM1]